VHIRVAGETDWQTLWSEANESTLFTSWDFHEFIATGATPVVALIGDKPVLGAWVSSTSYPFAAHQGLLTRIQDYSLRRQLLLVKEFLTALVSEYGHLSIEVSANAPYGLAIRWLDRSRGMNADLTQEFSAVIDTRQKAMRPPLARDRRAALVRAAGIDISHEAIDSTEIVKLLRMTFERQGLALREDTEIVVGHYCKYAARYGRMNHAKIAGETIGTTLFLQDSSAAYYVIGANHPAYRRRGVGTSLVEDQVRHYLTSGVKRIDLMSANDPHRGSFKVSLATTVHASWKVVLSMESAAKTAIASLSC
jgi:GNAT superfamily N-acetyltransferase